MEGEVWCKIPGYSKYSASSIGRIRNDNGKNQGYVGLILKGSEKNGYLRYGVVDDTGKSRCVFGHRLVAYAWLGPRPEGRFVAHLDGSRVNNSPNNLVWATPKENTGHRKHHGTWPNGENNANCKVSGKDVRRIRSGEFSGMNDTQIGNLFGITDKQVNSIRHFRTWKSIEKETGQ